VRGRGHFNRRDRYGACAGLRTALLGSTAFVLVSLANTAVAQVDATWIAPTNVTGEWTDGANWTGNTPPNGAADIARFNTEGSVAISSNVTVDTIDLQAGGPSPFSFTVTNGANFTIISTLANTSGVDPAFTVNAGSTLTLGDGLIAPIGSLSGSGNVVIGQTDPFTPG
jgi:hypothetical protein